MGNPISHAPLGAAPPSPSRRKTYGIWSFAVIAIAAALFAVLRSSPAAAADPASTMHAEGGLAMEWSILQYPAVALQANGFQLQLTNAGNEPVSGAAISVKLEMLDMVCGDYTFELLESSPGVYEGEGVPLMPGRWRATASVTPEGGDSFTVTRTLKAVY